MIRKLAQVPIQLIIKKDHRCLIPLILRSGPQRLARIRIEKTEGVARSVPRDYDRIISKVFSVSIHRSRNTL